MAISHGTFPSSLPEEPAGLSTPQVAPPADPKWKVLTADSVLILESLLNTLNEEGWFIYKLIYRQETLGRFIIVAKRNYQPNISKRLGRTNSMLSRALGIMERQDAQIQKEFKILNSASATEQAQAVHSDLESILKENSEVFNSGPERAKAFERVEDRLGSGVPCLDSTGLPPVVSGTTL